MVLIAGSIFFFYTKPAYDDVHVRQIQIAQYDQALDKAAQLQQIKQSLLTRFNAFDPNDVARLQKMLPDHVDNISLILDLNSLASKHGMSLENVDVTNASNNTQTNVSNTIGASQEDYDSLTLRFTTHSTYRNFEQFLEDLESSLRIVDLTSLSIAQDSSNTARVGGAPTYQYQITIRTYWLK